MFIRNSGYKKQISTVSHKLCSSYVDFTEKCINTEPYPSTEPTEPSLTYPLFILHDFFLLLLLVFIRYLTFIFYLLLIIIVRIFTHPLQMICKA